MKRLVCILCVIVLLGAGLTSCKSAKYEETIVGMQGEIDELEVDKEELEDKNDDLLSTIQELEARPTCTPTPEPTPILAPLNEPLDITITDFLMSFVRYICIYDEDDRPIELDEIAFVELGNFLIAESSKHPRLTDYYYSYENVNILVEVDDMELVHSVFVHSDDIINPDGSVDDDKLTLVILVQAIVLQSIYGLTDGTDLFVDITDAFVDEEVRIVKHDNINIFAIDVNVGSVTLLVVREPDEEDVA